VRIRIRIEQNEWLSKEVAYDYSVPLPVLNDILPAKMFPGMSFLDITDAQRREELRRKWIDMISSNIAYALTDYLLTKQGEDKYGELRGINKSVEQIK